MPPLAHARPVTVLCCAVCVCACRVQHDGADVLLHELHAMEWLDSPEYVARQSARGATFQVHIRALPPLHRQQPDRPNTPNPTSPTDSLTLSSAPPEDACRVLVLPYSVLERVYRKMPHLRGAMECVVARDVTHKLFATGEAVRGVQKLSATIKEQIQQAEAQQQQQPQQQALKDDEEKKESEG